MAYKFQFGPAVMSGSLEQEGGDIDIAAGALKIAGTETISSAGKLAAASISLLDTDDLAEGGALYYTDARARASNSVTDAGGDGSLAYNNTSGVFTYTGPSAAEARAHISVTDAGGDGSAAYNSSTGVITYTGPNATEVRAHFSAGAGLDYSAGIYTIGTAEVVDAMLNDDVATGLAGAGLSDASGVMAVEVSGALKVGAGGSGKLGVSGSIAGIALGFIGAPDSIFGLDVQFDNSSIDVSSNQLQVKDLGVTVGKMANLADGSFLLGNASTRPVAVAMSGDLTMTNAGAVAFTAAALEKVDDQVNALCVGGSGITITYDDGAGTLTFASDAGSTTPVARGDANVTLSEGFNFGSTTLTADRTWTLPAAPADGDIVRVKAPAVMGGFKIIVVKGDAAHSIDGQPQLELEASGTAISLIFLGSNAWGIF